MSSTQHARAGLIALLAGLPAATASQDPAGSEPICRYPVLDNGALDHPLPDFVDKQGLRRIPWWRSAAGADQVEAAEEGFALRTAGEEWASQPIPAYAPLVGGIEVSGRVRGRGRLTLTDGAEREATWELGEGEERWHGFRLGGEEIAARLGGAPQPRLDLRLAAGPGGEPARWTDLEAWIDLPCPSEEALREEILGELRWIFALWIERGLDREGPVHTGFLSHRHDAITGERLSTIRSAFNPFFDCLMDALEAEEVPAWREAFDAFVEGHLRYGLHPDTGFPQLWDPVADRALGDRHVEISLALGFLIDLAEHGSADQREANLAAARRIGEGILERGCMPDGAVAPRYRPRDAAPDRSASPIRSLDLPAQLARLGVITGEERYLEATRRAFARLEYTHSWRGSWDFLDPGFDDHFGYFGQRSVRLWELAPDEHPFSDLARTGFDYYLPLWRDAVRLGAFVAADEVRCWEIIRDICRLDPELRPRAVPLLSSALRAHVKGQQYAHGVWGDTSHSRFDPMVNVEIGDQHAVPRNLLIGLAVLYDEELGLRRDELRALFTAVMRSTLQVSRRPFGLLGTLDQKPDHNPAGASVRFGTGLVEMLRRL